MGEPASAAAYYKRECAERMLTEQETSESHSTPTARMRTRQGKRRASIRKALPNDQQAERNAVVDPMVDQPTPEELEKSFSSSSSDVSVSSMASDGSPEKGRDECEDESQHAISTEKSDHEKEGNHSQVQLNNEEKVIDLEEISHQSESLIDSDSQFREDDDNEMPQIQEQWSDMRRRIEERSKDEFPELPITQFPKSPNESKFTRANEFLFYKIIDAVNKIRVREYRPLDQLIVVRRHLIENLETDAHPYAHYDVYHKPETRALVNLTTIGKENLYPLWGSQVWQLVNLTRLFYKQMKIFNQESCCHINFLTSHSIEALEDVLKIILKVLPSVQKREFWAELVKRDFYAAQHLEDGWKRYFADAISIAEQNAKCDERQNKEKIDKINETMAIMNQSILDNQRRKIPKILQVSQTDYIMQRLFKGQREKTMFFNPRTQEYESYEEAQMRAFNDFEKSLRKDERRLMKIDIESEYKTKYLEQEKEIENLKLQQKEVEEEKRNKERKKLIAENAPKLKQLLYSIKNNKIIPLESANTHEEESSGQTENISIDYSQTPSKESQPTLGIPDEENLDWLDYDDSIEEATDDVVNLNNNEAMPQVEEVDKSVNIVAEEATGVASNNEAIPQVEDVYKNINAVKEVLSEQSLETNVLMTRLK